MVRFYSAGALALAFVYGAIAQEEEEECGNCQSFGVDFENGGSYFQNSFSDDPFTALQRFTGCTNDTSYNVLTDPRGDQRECSQTPLQPDNTPQLVTCADNLKNDLFSGEWSLMVLSNNGGCQPIAKQRYFSLSVGPQSTETVIPTTTVKTTTTPIETVYKTETQTITATAKPTTTTVPKININPTITIVPLPSITVVKKALYTKTKTINVPKVVATATVTGKSDCGPKDGARIMGVPTAVPDPDADTVATILGDRLEVGIQRADGRALQAQATNAPVSDEVKRAILSGRSLDPEAKARFLAERHEALVDLKKRAPDVPTVTVVDPEATPVTEEQTITAPASTVTEPTTVLDTITSTPTVTVSKGIDIDIDTTKLPRKTITLTKWTGPTTVTTTKTEAVTLTITSSGDCPPQYTG